MDRTIRNVSYNGQIYACIDDICRMIQEAEDIVNKETDPIHRGGAIALMSIRKKLAKTNRECLEMKP